MISRKPCSRSSKNVSYRKVLCVVPELIFLIEYDPEFGMGDHMFNDLALSRDQMREYNEHRAKVDGYPREQRLSVMVLQRSFWPFASRKNDIDLPPHARHFE